MTINEDSSWYRFAESLEMPSMESTEIPSMESTEIPSDVESSADDSPSSSNPSPEVAYELLLEHYNNRSCQGRPAKRMIIDRFKASYIPSSHRIVSFLPREIVPAVFMRVDNKVPRRLCVTKKMKYPVLFHRSKSDIDEVVELVEEGTSPIAALLLDDFPSKMNFRFPIFVLEMSDMMLISAMKHSFTRIFIKSKSSPTKAMTANQSFDGLKVQLGEDHDAKPRTANRVAKGAMMAYDTPLQLHSEKMSHADVARDHSNLDRANNADSSSSYDVEIKEKKSLLDTVGRIYGFKPQSSGLLRLGVMEKYKKVDHPAGKNDDVPSTSNSIPEIPSGHHLYNSPEDQVYLKCWLDDNRLPQSLTVVLEKVGARTVEDVKMMVDDMPEVLDEMDLPLLDKVKLKKAVATAITRSSKAE